MSTVGFIQRSLDFTHAALVDARNGTDEQLHFVPDHGSHSIAWCLWHTSRVEDLIMSGSPGRRRSGTRNGLRAPAFHLMASGQTCPMTRPRTCKSPT